MAKLQLKLIILMLLLMLSPQLKSGAPSKDCSKRQVISDQDLPYWVPADKELRINFVLVLNSAEELACIKDSPYELLGVKKKGKSVIVQVRRGTLSAELDLGEFDKISKVSIKDGKLLIDYDPSIATTKEKALFAGGGCISGFFFGVLAFLLFL